jgi:hypothetical protein
MYALLELYARPGRASRTCWDCTLRHSSLAAGRSPLHAQACKLAEHGGDRDRHPQPPVPGQAHQQPEVLAQRGRRLAASPKRAGANHRVDVHITGRRSEAGLPSAPAPKSQRLSARSGRCREEVFVSLWTCGAKGSTLRVRCGGSSSRHSAAAMFERRHGARVLLPGRPCRSGGLSFVDGIRGARRRVPTRSTQRE